MWPPKTQSPSECPAHPGPVQESSHPARRNLHGADKHRCGPSHRKIVTRALAGPETGHGTPVFAASPFHGVQSSCSPYRSTSTAARPGPAGRLTSSGSVDARRGRRDSPHSFGLAVHSGQTRTWRDRAFGRGGGRALAARRHVTPAGGEQQVRSGSSINRRQL